MCVRLLILMFGVVGNLSLIYLESLFCLSLMILLLMLIVVWFLVWLSFIFIGMCSGVLGLRKVFLGFLILCLKMLELVFLLKMN